MAKTAALLIAFFLCQIATIQGHPEGSSSDESSDESAEIKAECAKELGIHEEMIKQLEENESLYSEQNNRCYVKCVFEKSGIIDDEGKYNVKAFEEVFTDIKDVETKLLECGNVKHDTICDQVWMVFECLKADEK